MRCGRTKGWRKISMSPYKVKPDPFWKNVRPAVPEDIVWASFVSARTYTVCFTGVVVNYRLYVRLAGLPQLE